MMSASYPPILMDFKWIPLPLEQIHQHHILNCGVLCWIFQVITNLQDVSGDNVRMPRHCNVQMGTGEASAMWEEPN